MRKAKPWHSLNVIMVILSTQFLFSCAQEETTRRKQINKSVNIVETEETNSTATSAFLPTSDPSEFSSDTTLEVAELLKDTAKQQSTVAAIIDTNDIIGSIDQNPLGNYNDSEVDNLLYVPYTYNPWAYLLSDPGQTDLKDLGISNLILNNKNRDWQYPTNWLMGTGASEWGLRGPPPTTSCNPDTQANCIPVKNIGGWCGGSVQRNIDEWLARSEKFDGPISFVANIDHNYRIKADYYTVCLNGKPTFKSYKDSNFTLQVDQSLISDDSAIEDFVAAGVIDKIPMTPRNAVRLLRKAKNLGRPITYVEVSMEPWNSIEQRHSRHRFNPKSYIEKLKIWYQAIKNFDPSVQVGAAALQLSENPFVANEWNMKLFKEASDYFDFLALHRYLGFHKESKNTAQIIPSLKTRPDLASDFSYALPSKDNYKYIFINSAGDSAQIYRQQLQKWAPAKVNVPIHMAFNIWGPPNVDKDNSPNGGSRLMTGFANAAFYLDQLWPQEIDGKYFPGVRHAFVGGLEGGSAWFLYPKNRQDPKSPVVYFPVWKIFKVLNNIGGKNIAKVTVTNKIANSVLDKRDALEIKALIGKGEKNIKVIIFNHDPANELTLHMQFKGMSVQPHATITTIGNDKELSFESFNDYDNPNRIDAVKKEVDLSLNKTADLIKDFIVPAHTFVFLELKQK